MHVSTLFPTDVTEPPPENESCDSPLIPSVEEGGSKENGIGASPLVGRGIVVSVGRISLEHKMCRKISHNETWGDFPGYP